MRVIAGIPPQGFALLLSHRQKDMMSASSAMDHISHGISNSPKNLTRCETRPRTRFQITVRRCWHPISCLEKRWKLANASDASINTSKGGSTLDLMEILRSAQAGGATGTRDGTRVTANGKKTIDLSDAVDAQPLDQAQDGPLPLDAVNMTLVVFTLRTV